MYGPSTDTYTHIRRKIIFGDFTSPVYLGQTKRTTGRVTVPVLLEVFVGLLRSPSVHTTDSRL